MSHARGFRCAEEADVWMTASEAVTAGEKNRRLQQKKEKVSMSELCEPQILFQMMSSVGFKLVKGNDS